MVVICGVGIILRGKLKNSQKKILREKLKGKCDHIYIFLAHKFFFSTIPSLFHLPHLLVPPFPKINSWEKETMIFPDVWPLHVCIPYKETSAPYL